MEIINKIYTTNYITVTYLLNDIIHIMSFDIRCTDEYIYNWLCERAMEDE